MKTVTAEAKRLEAIINTATDGIVTIDDRGYIETVNKAAADLFQYNEEELIGQKINMLMPQPYRREHDSYMDNYHRTGHAKIIGIGRKVTGLKKDGSVFPLRLAVSEMRINDQRLYTGIIHDLSDLMKAEQKIMSLNRQLELKIADRTEELATAVDKLLNTNHLLKKEINERQTVETQLRQQEQELQQALTKEKELNALKTRFVSMASHEFKTPLSTILTSAELVELYTQEVHQNKRMRHIERIKSAVNNLNNILDDFLSLGRLEEGRLETQLTHIPLSAFLLAFKEEVSVILKPNQQLIIQDNTNEQLVKTDVKILKNILLNLVSNACKYSKDGTDIIVEANIKEQELDISIIDQGMGIPLQDQKHLFTRFFRAHNVENIKGTGLGLHIVKRYTDLLQGSIAFKSEEGKGSTFIVSIPFSNGFATS